MISAAVALGALASLLAWLVVLLRPSRGWDLRPFAEDTEPALPSWPPVVAVVPARNEAGSLPATLPALAAQSYPGPFRIVVVDDRSSDGTGDVARFLARTGALEDRLDVVDGAPLPDGWIGKPWAMEQGLRRAGVLETGGERAAYVLLVDADIVLGSRVVRRLVAEAMTEGLALDSRMALLHCRTLPERLLIPAFDYFFATLYPMRRVNDPKDRLAAAAGGCMLLSAEALRGLGGLACIRDRVIDDVSLASAIKGAGGRIKLSRSRGLVRSLRTYDTVSGIWAMVRRTAFTELRHSWARLSACLLGLALLFVVPPLAMLVAPALASPWSAVTLAAGALAWLLPAASFVPAVRAHRLWPTWALSLPVAGILYGAMTLDSAIRHAGGRAEAWRSA